MTRTLILGAGFGGLEAATRLHRHFGARHEVILVDQSEHFLAGLRKLWALTGLGTLDEGRRSRASLTAPGIRFLPSPIEKIDASARRVETAHETLEADYLVVALGADVRPDLIPGLAEHAHNLYDAAAIPGLANTLAGWDGGRIALVIAGAPYKCPPAPYECALLLDENLRKRGLRKQSEILVTTLQPMLLPNAGKAGSVWLEQQLSSRGIEARTGHQVRRVEGGRVEYADAPSIDADLIIAVPPHRAPAVVLDSGLADDSGWVPVNPQTLETAQEGVYAVGDVTRIVLANGLPLPKAGLMAELQGARVAAAIAAACDGAAPPAPFDGQGYCFIETQEDAAALVEGDFFAKPEPRVVLKEISESHARDKRRFESERLLRWFGH